MEGWVEWIEPRTTTPTAAERRRQALAAVADLDGRLSCCIASPAPVLATGPSSSSASADGRGLLPSTVTAVAPATASNGALVTLCLVPNWQAVVEPVTDSLDDALPAHDRAHLASCGDLSRPENP